MASFVLSFFLLDVLDEIWDLIEAVSEGFLTYSFRITFSDTEITLLQKQQLIVIQPLSYKKLFTSKEQ